jgi:Amino acid permease
MTIPLEGESGTKPQLIRGISLGSATALNMIDMIGVGPFITIPLIISAMGGPQAMLGWVLGAVLAICDGLVWAELGAAMPGSGGSYRYLLQIYGPQKLGRLVSFLFIWQLSFSAPLSIASGAIGLSQYAAFFWPRLELVWSTRTWALHLPLVGTLQLTWVAMPVDGVSPVSAHHRDRAAYQSAVGGGDGHHRVDHFRRANPLQRASGIRFTSGGIFIFARLLSRTGRGDADCRL